MKRVEDMQAADRWFKALAAKKRELAAIEEYRKGELERLEAWYKKESEGLIDDIESLENELKAYYEAMLAENPRVKLSTPYGKVTKRTSTKWNWDDEKLLQGLKDKGLTEFVKVETKEIPMKAEIKKAFTIAGDKVIDPNGEVFDLADVSEETTYSVKVVGVDD